LTFINGHIAEDDLESYSASALPDQSLVLVESHLLVCGECRQRLVETEDYMAAIKSAARRFSRSQPAGSRWRWSFPRFMPAFAAVGLLAIAAVTIPLLHRGATAPFAVNLETVRGSETPAAAPSGQTLLLRLDLTGLPASPSYRVEMVDQGGAPVWQGELKAPEAVDARSIGTIAIPAQKRGAYFVRVALPSRETLREYGLQLSGTN
jgi:hypothetical protein